MREKYVKYPRTLHVPWSRPTSDDKILKDDSIFHNQNVVVTLKMDGENTTMYDDKIHARSINSANNNHFTRDWVKGEWGRIKHTLKGLRICGENVWAQHTITYDDLDSFFYVFSIWDNYENSCYNWEHTKFCAEALDLLIVPVIYEGVYDADLIHKIFEAHYAEKHEGYVIRNTRSFHYDAFSENVAKYVKQKFHDDLQEKNVHWMSAKIEPNKLKGNE